MKWPIDPNLHFQNRNFAMFGSFLCKKCLDVISAKKERKKTQIEIACGIVDRIAFWITRSSMSFSCLVSINVCWLIHASEFY